MLSTAMHDSPDAPIIDVTPAGRRPEVLRLLHLGVDRTERLLAAAHCGDISMDGLLHARRGKTFVGAAWGQPVPGRTAFCWPASLLPDEPEQTAHRLQTAVDQYLDSCDVVSTQALLPPRDALHAIRLTHAGYQHVADVECLMCSDTSFPTQRPAGALTFCAGYDADSPRLQSLVEDTYVDSLDCNRLVHFHHIDDVLCGYRRTGVYRPDWWIVAAATKASMSAAC